MNEISKKLQNIKLKRKQIDKLHIDLERSVAIASLCPGIYDKPGIVTSQWTPANDIKNSRLVIKLNNKIVDIFKFNDVPSLLKPSKNGSITLLPRIRYDKISNLL